MHPEVIISTSSDWVGGGGNSLKAIELVTRAREEKVCITVADVLRHPQLGDMSRLLRDKADMDLTNIKPFSLLSIDASLARKHAAEACNIDEMCIEDIFPCTPMQIAMVAQMMYMTERKLLLHANIDPTRLMKAWKMVSKHISALRTRIVHLPASRAESYRGPRAGTRGRGKACEDRCGNVSRTAIESSEDFQTLS